jgi:hypothetical protein
MVPRQIYFKISGAYAVTALLGVNGLLNIG